MGPYNEEYDRGKYNLILQASESFLDKRSEWFPNCYDHTLVGPRRGVLKKCEIGFCGNVLNRKPWLEFLSQRFDFRADIFVIGESMVRAINSYKMHFNCNLGVDMNYRNFETIGCGVPLIAKNTAPVTYERMGFRHAKNCILWNKKEDLEFFVNTLVKNEALAEEIGSSSLDLARNHTYDKRAEMLIELAKDYV